MRPGDVVTDSAGITCRYTRVADIKPGDVVISGWRSTVSIIERDGSLYRLWWEEGGYTLWLAEGQALPVEVVAPSAGERR